MNTEEYYRAALSPLSADFRGARIFLTGGTGFFGKTILESVQHVNRLCGLDVRVTVLCRDPASFTARYPRLGGERAFHFVKGDILHMDIPPAPHTHFLHAATPASARLAAEEPLVMMDTVVDGTRNVLTYAHACGATHFLLTSSGAVYGTQPPDLPRIPENTLTGPDITVPSNSYHEAKRLAELMCVAFGNRYGLSIRLARCFAFVGDHLPLDTHFAIGNFIRDALRGNPIIIQGDGTPFRSYLDARELAVWLWTLLFRGTHGFPVNIGSDQAIDIKSLAHLVSTVGGETRGTPVAVEVRKEPPPGVLPSRYVPSVDRARETLGLIQRVPLPESIRDVMAFHRGSPGSTP